MIGTGREWLGFYQLANFNLMPQYCLMPIRELTEFDFHSTLAASKGVSLVMLSGPDCGACRRMEETLPELTHDLVDHLFKVDVQKSAGLARAYEIFHLPSLFVFVDGHYHGPLHAEPTRLAFLPAIKDLLASPAQEEP
jgi:thioredoxin 1